MDSLDKGAGAPATGETWVVASTSGVKVRKTSSPDGSVLGVLGLGSVITVTKQVRNGPDDLRGYVTSAKLGEGSWGQTDGGWCTLIYCVKGTPSKWVVTASVGLNLRRKADVNSAREALLPLNTQLTVTDIVKNGDYTWGRVAYAKAPDNEYWMDMGWVALEYCKKA